uniref:Uncharacterized protein n=1 Tax=Rhizophora mucronata TaxID=61149 RepID=A0A2P2NR03_RHIMU
MSESMICPLHLPSHSLGYWWRRPRRRRRRR